MISFESSGSWKGTFSFLDRCGSDDPYKAASKFAEEGVMRLRDATPIESGITASGWSYELETESDDIVIWFVNDHEVDGFNVAVGLQYGHATNGGGWVPGTDYINPALKPIFDKMAEAAWKEVTK